MVSIRRKKLFWIAAVVAGILAITSPLMVAAWRQGQAFNRVFDTYSEALIHGDLDKAYAMAGAEFRTATGFSEFVRQHEDLIHEEGAIVKIKRGRTIVEGQGSPLRWAAVTTASFTCQHGTATLIYEFHFEDGAWRIYGYRRETQ